MKSISRPALGLSLAALTFNLGCKTPEFTFTNLPVRPDDTMHIHNDVRYAFYCSGGSVKRFLGLAPIAGCQFEFLKPGNYRIELKETSINDLGNPVTRPFREWSISVTNNPAIHFYEWPIIYSGELTIERDGKEKLIHKQF